LRTAFPNPFGFGGFGGQAIQVTIAGSDPDKLNDVIGQVTQAMQQVPGVVDVNNSNQRVVLEYDVTIDQTRAADLGVSAQTAGSALATAVSGQAVTPYGRYSRPSSSGSRVLRYPQAIRSLLAARRLPVLKRSVTSFQRDQTRAQCLLERLTHAEIRRQRKRREQLGQSQTFGHITIQPDSVTH